MSPPYHAFFQDFYDGWSTRRQRSCDWMSYMEKNEIKRELLRVISSEAIRSLPEEIIYEFSSNLHSGQMERLERCRTSASHNKSSTISELLAHLPRSRQTDPPWWETLDRVLQNYCHEDLYRAMNPWLVNQGPLYPKGPLYPRNTLLSSTNGIARYLVPVCVGGTWHILAENLGLNIEDLSDIESRARDNNLPHLILTQCSRRCKGATVETLTRALLSLGDDGRSVIRQIENDMHIQPVEHTASGAVGGAAGGQMDGSIGGDRGGAKGGGRSGAMGGARGKTMGGAWGGAMADKGVVPQLTANLSSSLPFKQSLQPDKIGLNVVEEDASDSTSRRGALPPSSERQESITDNILHPDMTRVSDAAPRERKVRNDECEKETDGEDLKTLPNQHVRQMLMDLASDSAVTDASAAGEAPSENQRYPHISQVLEESQREIENELQQKELGRTLSVPPSPSEESNSAQTRSRAEGRTVINNNIVLNVNNMNTLQVGSGNKMQTSITGEGAVNEGLPGNLPTPAEGQDNQCEEHSAGHQDTRYSVSCLDQSLGQSPVGHREQSLFVSPLDTEAHETHLKQYLLEDGDGIEDLGRTEENSLALSLNEATYTTDLCSSSNATDVVNPMTSDPGNRATDTTDLCSSANATDVVNPMTSDPGNRATDTTDLCSSANATDVVNPMTSDPGNRATDTTDLCSSANATDVVNPMTSDPGNRATDTTNLCSSANATDVVNPMKRDPGNRATDTTDLCSSANATDVVNPMTSDPGNRAMDTTDPCSSANATDSQPSDSAGSDSHLVQQTNTNETDNESTSQLLNGIWRTNAICGAIRSFVNACNGLE